MLFPKFASFWIPRWENSLRRDLKVSKLSLFKLDEAKRRIKVLLHDLSPYCRVLI